LYHTSFLLLTKDIIFYQRKNLSLLVSEVFYPEDQKVTCAIAYSSEDPLYSRDVLRHCRLPTWKNKFRL